MKKAIYTCAVLSAITSLIALFAGYRMLTGHGFFINLRLFNIAASGTANGFIGNILSIAITCLGFGALAVFGFMKNQSAKRSAFGYGIVMTAICLISMIAAIIGRNFMIGDLYLFILPAVYTILILKSA